MDFLHDRNPSDDLSAKAVAMRLTRAGHWLEIQLKRRLGALGIDLWELEILATLSRLNGSTSIGRLQDAAQVTAGAITSRVARLEDKGFLTRTIDTADRRQVRVELTTAGWTRAAKVIVANDEAQRDALSHIDARLIMRLSNDLREFLLSAEGAGQPDPSTE
ncbi:MarR family winged helix-turn-helix transcriptional regulator [Mycolicibacterium sp. CBMA 226]|uniref:MarR family winged helix-turn-helix transcriptional regulator n=1 Tax=Mycolicibacterium sp. CBMA 226 TaxID=2606611 RepID=UPI001FB7DED2|nr:MarR family transcriptional regulator [Mycolicibacterium sp. CBMA 226]